MSEAGAIETMPVRVTDGTIAAINLNSALAQSWGRFWQAPLQPAIAERLVEQELLNAQFLGDLGAYGRLEQMVSHLLRIDSTSARTALVDAQVAASTHRFADARAGLAQAMERGAPAGATDRLAMSIDQACGTELDALLETRLRLAAQSGRLEDWMPLGALLADLREFDEAEQAYCRALDAYSDVSPFAVAWVFFQLGVLWGELVPEPQVERAARWYSKAIAYLPDYVKARVHLAEIRLGQGRHADARTALVPALASGDPQASWRLSDVSLAMGRPAQAEAQLNAARSGFESLLGRHLLAFADHAAEFYGASGNDVRKALELARIDVPNRPTLRAFERAHAAALAAGDMQAAQELLTAGRLRWGSTRAFRWSPLAAAAVG